jgi:hypothetical protein
MDKTSILSYALAVIAGVCFAGGVTILTNGRVDKHGQAGANHSHVG